MGERGRVRRDRVHAALGSFLAFCLTNTLQHAPYQDRAWKKQEMLLDSSHLNPGLWLTLFFHTVLVLMGE